MDDHIGTRRQRASKKPRAVPSRFAERRATASFPWYDLARVQWANDAIWAAMYPTAEPLTRKMPYERQWHCPDLIISQACGLDLFLTRAPIQPVFAPVFELADCPEGKYFSYLIGTPGRGVAAVNSLSSRSGCTSLLTLASPRAFLVTGSHRRSIQAVREKHAAFACIDAVTWHLLERDEPQALEDIARVDQTDFAMAPPYVVRQKSTGDTADRLQSAMSDPVTADARGALLIRSIKSVRRSDYEDSRLEFERVRDRFPRDRRVYRP